MADAPPPIAYVEEAANDEPHLRALVICNWVFAGLALVGCAGSGVISIVMGQVMGKTFQNLPVQPGQPGPPPEFGDMMETMYFWTGLGYIAAGIFFSCVGLVSALALQRRRGHTLCFVLAAIECLALPVGTVLGIFTILVISRPAVQAAFRRNEAPRA